MMSGVGLINSKLTIGMIFSVCLLLPLIIPTKSYAQFDFDDVIPVGELFKNIIDGNDYEGKEIFVSGVVAEYYKGDPNLLILATAKTYDALVRKHSMAIFYVPDNLSLRKGQAVILKIRVESDFASHMDNGRQIPKEKRTYDNGLVTIESYYLLCVSCEDDS